MTIKIVKSLKDFLDSIENNRDRNFGNLHWYRAENSLFNRTLLMPNLFREYVIGPSTTEKFYHKEWSTRNVFKLEAYPFLDNPDYAFNDLTIMFLMQHYGAETRLLDWSDNALIALFFAVENIQCQGDGLIWVLNPLRLNASTTKIANSVKNNEYKIFTSLDYDEQLLNYFDIDILSTDSVKAKYPIAIKPHYIDSRMKNQSSCFTLFGHDGNGLLNHPDNMEFLQKIVIPKENFRKIKRDLFQLGVSYDTIYPGLEGISKKIVYAYDEYFI